MILVSPRLRAILLVTILAVAAAAAALMVLGRREAVARPTLESAPPAASTPAAPAASPATPTPQRHAAATTGLPAPVADALAANRVVVVSLFDPEAKLDVTATREAGAGAN